MTNLYVQPTLLPDGTILPFIFGTEILLDQEDMPSSNSLKRALRKNKLLRFHPENESKKWRLVDADEATGLPPVDKSDYTPAANKPEAATLIADTSAADLELTKNRIGDFAPEEAVQFASHSPELAAYVRTAKRPDWLEIPDLTWKASIMGVLNGYNILFRGRQGCGKTSLARALGEATRRNVHVFNMGATQDPRLTLVGSLYSDGAEKGTQYYPSRFARAIQEPNAIIMLDELSRATVEAWNILMPVLDPDQRILQVDENRNGYNLKVAEGVIFISTANVGLEFTAAGVIDAALTDRALTIDLYAPTKDGYRRRIKHEFKTIPAPAADLIADLARWTVDQADGVPAADDQAPDPDDNPVDQIISPRIALRLAGAMVSGLTFREACTAILNYFSKDGGAESEFSYVMKYVQKSNDFDIYTAN